MASICTVPIRTKTTSGLHQYSATNAGDRPNRHNIFVISANVKISQIRNTVRSPSMSNGAIQFASTNAICPVPG